MTDFILKTIETKNIEPELKKIGFDDGYSFVAKNKFLYKNIKIYDLSPAQANILKQTALSVGADCATHREVITGKIEKSNVILGASVAQIKKISQKLTNQPFGLKNLAESILNLIEPKERKTKLVGILNITEDSFSDGGLYIEPLNAQKRLFELIEEGADIIDIGAESTKPYSSPIDSKTQIERIKPILNIIEKDNISIPISIDTRSSEVADFALNNGAQIINDVSGLEYDKKLANTVSKYNAGIIIQHSQGTPDNMQINPHYNDVIEDIYFSLKNKTEYAQSLGIKDVIIDVGIGFGKSKNHNFELLERIEEFYSLNYPVMVGVSRKSLLGIKQEDNNLKDSLTLAVSYPLMLKGVDYLRVHNVKLHKTLLNILQ